MPESTRWSGTRWSSCSSGPTVVELPSHLWAQYGLAGVLEFEGFVRDVTNAATNSGVSIEQFHPEYGMNQFEISLTPQSPVAAADQLLLMRIIVGRVATAVRPTGQPLAGAVRRQRGFWCTPALFD